MRGDQPVVSAASWIVNASIGQTLSLVCQGLADARPPPTLAPALPSAARAGPPAWDRRRAERPCKSTRDRRAAAVTPGARSEFHLGSPPDRWQTRGKRSSLA